MLYRPKRSTMSQNEALAAATAASIEKNAKARLDVARLAQLRLRHETLCKQREVEKEAWLQKEEELCGQLEDIERQAKEAVFGSSPFDAVLESIIDAGEARDKEYSPLPKSESDALLDQLSAITNIPVPAPATATLAVAPPPATTKTEAWYRDPKTLSLKELTLDEAIITVLRQSKKPWRLADLSRFLWETDIPRAGDTRALYNRVNYVCAQLVRKGKLKRIPFNERNSHYAIN